MNLKICIIKCIALTFLYPQENITFPEETHFKNLKQLTFSGENGEAYFSADGTKLIFQAHDGDDLCDQIYIMTLASGIVQQISQSGVTTCSYFQYPDDSRIIFASTHLGSAACPPKPDYSLGYVWSLYPDYDIFRALPNGTGLERLTFAHGYDAEGTYAFDGSEIVYTSVSSGDLEVWTMHPDGTNKTQFTDRLGYDGGPFFSHDGTKIVWRAYYPETEEEITDYKNLLAQNLIRPMALQVWIMNRNGSNKQQVTDNNGTNFGPFFFPDDQRIVFSSNMHDPQSRNFDLYSVDINGDNLERITFYEGFDGFPMFSLDGNYFVFASNRNQAQLGETNIFICEWVN